MKEANNQYEDQLSNLKLEAYEIETKLNKWSVSMSYKIRKL